MPTAIALTSLIVLPFFAAAAMWMVPANDRKIESWLAGAVAILGFAATMALFPAIASGGAVRHDIDWIPALGLNLVLRIDGLAWLFCVLVTFIGFLVVLYARYYLSPKDKASRFFAYFLAFMGAMLGLVTAGNLIQLAIFWEMTSLTSFLLIGYWYHRSDARDGARMALIVTGTGGLALLVGLLIIGHIVGSYDLDVVLSSGDLIRNHPLYVPALILMLLGAFTKSAQFPFQFWLPRAMAAPTPVSAYLHSATMVKAGVFLMIRFWPVMSGTDAWFWIVTSAGLITLVMGAYSALFQRDLKGLLAYSTISHLGLITTLLGMGTPLAAVAAIFHTANHATFKASLFMAAGIIDHETGTRDIGRLSGLRRLMPFTATLAIVASAAMAGVPLLNGFLSKEMFFTETALYDPNMFVNLALPIGATIAGIFSVAYSLRFVHGVFFGPPPVGLEKTPHEPPALMRRPIELLVLICLAVGIFPAVVVGPYLKAAVLSVLGSDTPYYSLSVWHGFNLPLVMSILAMVGGVVLYLSVYRYLAKGKEGTPVLRHLHGQRAFERILVTITSKWAKRVEEVMGTRRLQPQLVIVVLVACLAAFMALAGNLGRIHITLEGFDPALAAVWLVGGGCALAAAYQAKFHRLAAMILLGGAGIATCITFVWFSAPDLALTQLVVEIVTTVLILLGLRWLPKRSPDPLMDKRDVKARVRHYRDGVIAALAGLGMAIIAFAVMTRPAPDGIANYFLENAYKLGGGTNVVNVMLVDFRGFDTFGEITVLAIVALTIYALLRRFRPAADNADMPHQQRVQLSYDNDGPEGENRSTVGDYLLIAALMMQWLFPVIIVIAFYFFMRGHDLPGGGFVAGIIMSIAFILQYMAGGTRWVEERLRILPTKWIGAGLGIALLTGLGASVAGYPFLTSYFRYAELGWLGRVPIASALLFDLGVFTLVVGATVLILIALAHQSVRKPKPAKATPKLPGTRPATDSPATTDALKEAR